MKERKKIPSSITLSKEISLKIFNFIQILLFHSFILSCDQFLFIYSISLMTIDYLSIQPVIHFQLFSEFLSTNEILQFFRCSKQISKIPTYHKIFLPYFNFKSISSTSSSSLFSFEFPLNFHFYFYSLEIFSLEEENLFFSIVKNKKFHYFTKLKCLILNFTSLGIPKPKFTNLEDFPNSIENLICKHLDYPELFFRLSNFSSFRNINI